MKNDIIIIGAGAAGLMCAIEAGKRGRSVLLLDHAEKAGQKIRISGGGRCNFTNIHMAPEHYLSGNPHFCKSALACFTPRDFTGLLEKYNIQYHEKEKGQLFCRKSSLDVLRMLQDEAGKAGVEIRLRCKVTGVRKEERFLVITNQGVMESESLVIATGGLSFPDLGATGIGYHIARHFGLRVTPLSPGLAPFECDRNDMKIFGALSGISLPVRVSCRGREFQGEMLFTHHGLSGPAILQVSSYWKPGDILKIDLLPASDALEIFRARHGSRIEMHNLLAELFPRRFARTWCDLHAGSKPICRYSDKELMEMAAQLHNWEILPQGTQGYRKAEVTLGGVDTEELSSKTMEARKAPGLYFVGEVLDVTGQLGGYNLHWAWASGYAAGQYA
ncbi:MAG: aminoacetone oxidase family FAD-binding enzyme [Nitrospira bacterium HGW-Nitrospira-1]|nr:MAG: aminoacetone oxidase family FAD-binding enzyme [Nitrospira bacterium HGW-Nitrospira-1]